MTAFNTSVCLMSATCLSVLLKLPIDQGGLETCSALDPYGFFTVSLQTRELYMTGSSIVVIATQTVPEAYRSPKEKLY